MIGHALRDRTVRGLGRVVETEEVGPIRRATAGNGRMGRDLRARRFVNRVNRTRTLRRLLRA